MKVEALVIVLLFMQIFFLWKLLDVRDPVTSLHYHVLYDRMLGYYKLSNGLIFSSMEEEDLFLRWHLIRQVLLSN